MGEDRASAATTEPLTCRCGLVMSENPHPDAGHPTKMVQVGATYVCIPCTMRALSGWASRAQRAERDARHYARVLRESGIDPEAGLA